MEKLRPTLFSLALVLAASFTLSCGASQSQGQLQAITLNPATADAQAYPHGQVQFIATGYYVNPSRTVTPLSVTWVACQQSMPLNVPTTAISVTQEGVAQCASGATGTYLVSATDPSGSLGTYSCPAGNSCGGGCMVVGTAQLTCP
jgi:hypothetical protein